MTSKSERTTFDPRWGFAMVALLILLVSSNPDVPAFGRFAAAKIAKEERSTGTQSTSDGVAPTMAGVLAGLVATVATTRTNLGFCSFFSGEAGDHKWLALGIAGIIIPLKHTITAAPVAVLPARQAVHAAEAAHVTPASALQDRTEAQPSADAIGRFARPSFDCRKAAQEAEKAICSDPRLGYADRLLAALYQATRVRAGNDQHALAAEKADQRTWWKARNLCAGDAHCISRTYDQRTSDLIEHVPARGQPGTAMKVGECVKDSIGSVGTRLASGSTESGVRVSYGGRNAGISYDPETEVLRSRAGDAVVICLESVPQGCPPGDDRGKVFFAHDLRTHENWSLPDSQHSCGGA
jgi:uncharacterized protein YecT (DUF1311 family)